MQLQKFGNLPEALAAYNAGPSNAENNTWSNSPETRKYVQSVPSAQPHRQVPTNME